MCRLVDVRTNYGEAVKVAEIKRDSIDDILNSKDVVCFDIKRMGKTIYRRF